MDDLYEVGVKRVQHRSKAPRVHFYSLTVGLVQHMLLFQTKDAGSQA